MPTGQSALESHDSAADSVPWAAGYSTIVVTRPRRDVIFATLCRPQRMNVITFAMFDEMSRLQRDIDADATARALVITGSGRGFCAGMDLDGAARLPDMTTAEMMAGQQRWASAISGFRHMTTPVIAAVNGAAAGAGMGLGAGRLHQNSQ